MVNRKIKTHINGINPTGEVQLTIAPLPSGDTETHNIPLNKTHDTILEVDLPYSKYEVTANYTGDEYNTGDSVSTVFDFRIHPYIKSEGDFWHWNAKWGVVPSVLQVLYNIYDDNDEIIQPDSILDSLVEFYPKNQQDIPLPQETLFIGNLQCFMSFIPLFAGESYIIRFKGDDAHEECTYEFTVPVELMHDHSADKYRSLYTNMDNGLHYNYPSFGMVSMKQSVFSSGIIKMFRWSGENDETADVKVLFLKPTNTGYFRANRAITRDLPLSLKYFFIDSREITGYGAGWLGDVTIQNNQLYIYGLRSDTSLYYGVSESEIRFLIDHRLNTGDWYSVDLEGSSISSYLADYAEAHRIALTNYSLVDVLSTNLTINVPLVLVYSDDFNITGVLTDEENNTVNGATVELLVGNTVVDSTTTDNNGEYSFTSCPVSMGTHSFTVQFNGDVLYDACTSSTVNREISRETSVLNVNSPVNNGTYTDSLNIAGSLLSDDGEVITGAVVTVSENGTVLLSLNVDSNGAFTGNLNITGWSTGNHDLIIGYDGDSYYTSCSMSRTVNIGGHVYDLTVTSTEDTIGVNGTVSSSIVTGVLRDNGVAVSGESVTVTVLDSTDTIIASTVLTTDNNGTVSYTYTAAGRGDVSIMMECMSLQETYVIEDILFYDSLTSDMGIWTKSSGTSIVSYNSNGLTFTGNGQYQDQFLTLNHTFMGDYCVSVTVTSIINGETSGIVVDGVFFENCGYSQSQRGTLGDSSTWERISPQIQNNDVVSLHKIGNEVKIYLNNVLLSTKTINSEYVGVVMLKTYVSRTFTIKNLKIKEL